MIACCENSQSMIKDILPGIFGLLGVIIGGLVTFFSTLIIENRKLRKNEEENKSRLIQDLYIPHY